MASHKSSVRSVVPLLTDTSQPQILIVDGNAIMIVIVINTVRALLSIPTKYIWCPQTTIDIQPMECIA